MLDSLDAWANGETVTAPAFTVNTMPRGGTRKSRRAATATPAPRGPILVTSLIPSKPLPGVVTTNHPFGDSEIAWLTGAAANGFGFAISICRQMRQGRTLTANQIETVKRLTREHAAKEAAKLAPAPVVVPVNARAGSMGSVQATPAPTYVAPSVAVPAASVETVTLSAEPIKTNWPVLFSTPEGNSVSDTGGNVLCIAAQGLPVKFSRFGAPGNAPVTVTIDESVWRDFVAMSRADFIANHLS